MHPTHWFASKNDKNPRPYFLSHVLICICMVGTTCRISSRNIRYSAEHSEFHFNIWLFGYAHITNPNIYIYISHITSWIYNCSTVVRWYTNHYMCWTQNMVCGFWPSHAIGILIPIPKLWLNQLIQSKFWPHLTLTTTPNQTWLENPWVSQYQNHITNHDSKPWLSHIPTIKLLSLVLSL